MMKFSFKDFETLESTNAYLMEIPENERVGTVVSAQEQTRGKGMGSNVWESQAGKNLTFSMGVDLSFLKAADQFLLSEAVPLGLMDVLDTIFVGSKVQPVPTEQLMVKWPNDLLYDGRKLCGILVNSTIHGQDMGVSVIGIGLNVNQMQFQDWPTRPISLRMILGHDVILEPLLHQLVEAVDRRIQLLRTEEGTRKIKGDYLSRLYRYHTWANYEVQGLLVRRYITGIDTFGRLETLDESGGKHVYDLKEIKFV